MLLSAHRLVRLPHNRKLLQESGELCSLYNRNPVCWDPIYTVAEVWWLFDGGFLLKAYTAMYHYCAAFF